MEFVLADQLEDEDVKKYVRYRKKHGPASAGEKAEPSKSLSWLLKRNGLTISVFTKQFPLSQMLDVERKAHFWAQELLENLRSSLSSEKLDVMLTLNSLLETEKRKLEKFLRPPDPKRERLFQLATEIYAGDKLLSGSARFKTSWGQALEKANSDSEGEIYEKGYFDLHFLEIEAHFRKWRQRNKDLVGKILKGVADQLKKAR